MNRSICVIGILLAIVILLAAQILAVNPNGAQISSEVSKGRFPTPGPSTVDVQAGNITMVGLVSNMTTIRWTGLFGNASGSLKLGDSGGVVMYSWTGEGNLVYLSQATPTWATLADASAANVDAAYTFIGVPAADNYTNTFSNAPENIGSNIFTLTSDYATTYNNTGGSVWKTYSLTDGSNIVFTGKVIHPGHAYDGETADYQMIIPEDGTGGNEAPTTWRIFIELV